MTHLAVAENTDELVVSSATLRNWGRLNTQRSGRLTARANKTRSSRRILPVEYVSNKENIPSVEAIIEYIDRHGIPIMTAIYSLGLNLLSRRGLAGKQHVITALRDWESVDRFLFTMSLPDDEFDLLGLIYQCFLREGERNRAGVYYTAPAVVRSMTQHFRLTDGETVLDPCCGSGAFLLATDAPDPHQLFGVDSDPAAVLIATVNLLLKYRDIEFIPQIYCRDFLASGSHIEPDPLVDTHFDYIVTNPPWGAVAAASSERLPTTSKETFSNFFVTAFQQLKPTGTIRFLFPAAILNVKAHRDIRDFILNTAGLVSITQYEQLFSGVTTAYVDIECSRGADRGAFTVRSGHACRRVDARTVLETDNLVFNLLTDEDVAIIRAVKARGANSLRDSTWGLGIVTGDNKGKLHAEPAEGLEQIFTGKEIRPYTLLPAQKFIRFDRASLQQVARDEIYRAPEKLVYKFISNKLVFAYDNTQSLFLNSANILIPSVPTMSIMTVLGFLNSSLFRYVYRTLFGEVKILKGNLLELTFPVLSKAQDAEISRLVARVLAGDHQCEDEVDDFIFSLYGLSESQQEYVRGVARGTAP